MDDLLPYHCAKLRGDFLREPCSSNLVKAREHRAKFPQALLGPLEHCLGCEGRELVVREVPLTETVSTGESTMQQLSPEKIARTRKMVQGMVERYGTESARQEEQAMGGVVKFRDEAELGAGKFQADPAPRCPKHPEEPQIACKGARAGQYLGACQVCMQERRVGRKGKEKMTPAVVRDLGIWTKPAPPYPLQPAPAPAPAPAVHGGEVTPARPMCLTHNLPIKFNAKGISMGGCEECRREIAAMGGHKAKIQLAANPLERVFAGYEAELAWLLQLAAEQLRTPAAQLVFLLRQTMQEEAR